MKITPHVLHLKLAKGQVKYHCNARQTYCPLLMRIRFTCTACLRVPKHSRRRWGQTYSYILSKHESISLHDLLYVCRHLFGVSFITALKVKFMHGSNHTGHCTINCIISHAKKKHGFPPAQTTKVNFKLLSPYQYVIEI